MGIVLHTRAATSTVVTEGEAHNLRLQLLVGRREVNDDGIEIALANRLDRVVNGVKGASVICRMQLNRGRADLGGQTN
jgi:hypothetical protein